MPRVGKYKIRSEVGMQLEQVELKYFFYVLK